ncbi:MAG TPA: DUF748 domain-containing protein [Usitatibacter sp.]|nr:DUF748 domain-containing protein [Usitatibacter sp.]
MNAPIPGTKRTPGWRIAARWILGAIAVYGIVGLFVAPPLARKLIVDNLSERLGRKVTLEEVSANPYTLRARVHGLKVYERDGRTEFASLSDFRVAISPASLYRWAPVVNRIAIAGLDVHLVRDADSHYNVSDILERLAKSPAETGPGPHEKARFALRNIRLARTNVDFDDRPRGVHHHVTDINLAVPAISTLDGDTRELVKPALSMRVNGAPFSLQGESLPFESDLHTRVSLGFDGVQVPEYVTYSPSKLPVKVNAGKLHAKIVVRFNRAASGDPAIDVGGTMGLDGLALSGLEPAGDVNVGRIEIEVASFDPLAGKAIVPLVRFTDVRARGGDWQLPLAQAQEIKADLHGRSIDVGELLTRGAQLALQRGPDGRLRGLESISASPTPDATPSKPWQVTVGKVNVDDWHLALSDQAMAPAVMHRVTLEHLGATNVSTASGAKTQVEGHLALGSGGRVDVRSSVVLQPFAVDALIDGRDIDLAPLKPYAAHFATVSLKGAKASMKGTVKVEGSGEAMRVAYKGGAELSDVATFDTVNKEELLDWKSVRAKGIDFHWARHDPLRLAVDEVAVDKAYARVVVTPDGRLNLQTLKFATPDNPTPAPQDPATLKPRNVAIHRIVFTGSRLDFADHFIKPNYSADVGNLGGSVTGLSSDPAARAKVKLEGSYAGKSPIVIAGTVNPLSGELFADIAAKGSDIELPQFSAYAARYAGYGITGGTLALDVDYHVENGKLQARNGIVLDHLTFGDKVESPEATKLPVLFAVNLLKDADGRIKVDLPISGSLEDPQFDVGKLVAQVVGNLFKKAVTSPFSLLSAALGGSSQAKAAGNAQAPDLGHVDFAAGDAKLDDEDRRKLAQLSEALAQRPAVKLELEPRVDAEKDTAALKAAGVKVDDASLKALAAERAQAVKQALEQKLPADRVIVADSSAAGEPGVAFSLR